MTAKRPTYPYRPLVVHEVHGYPFFSVVTGAFHTAFEQSRLDADAKGRQRKPHGRRGRRLSTFNKPGYRDNGEKRRLGKQLRENLGHAINLVPSQGVLADTPSV